MFNFIVFLLAAFVMLGYLSFRFIDWLLTVWWWLPWMYEWVEVTSDAEEAGSEAQARGEEKAFRQAPHECLRVRDAAQGGVEAEEAVR